MENKTLIGTIYATRYQLLKLIGEGAFGKVFIAKDLLSLREVAVKLVSYITKYRKL
jgi:serine/threonine protein kinase